MDQNCCIVLHDVNECTTIYFFIDEHLVGFQFVATLNKCCFNQFLYQFLGEHLRALLWGIYLEQEQNFLGHRGYTCSASVDIAKQFFNVTAPLSANFPLKSFLDSSFLHASMFQSDLYPVLFRLPRFFRLNLENKFD